MDKKVLNTDSSSCTVLEFFAIVFFALYGHVTVTNDKMANISRNIEFE